MEHVQKTWRVLELLKVSENLLREKDIDNPRLNAELLLCDVLKEPRINLYLDFEKPLSEEEITDYRAKIRRRLNREPLQYILGYTEFYGLRFKVTPDVLIPRPETEILVEKAIESISSFNTINPRALEIGTGSGCISIAIASRVSCKIDAIDISTRALSIAEHNSENNGTSSKISFINRNLLTDYTDFGGYDVVLSNPPYVSSDEMKITQEEIKKYEPQIALTDDEEGLSFYRKIIGLFGATSSHVKLFLEIGDRKKDAVEKILGENKITKPVFYRDYHGIERVLYLEK